MRKWLLVACVLMARAAPGDAAQTDNFTLDRNLFHPSVDMKVTSVFTPAYSGNASFLLYNSAGEMIKNFKAAPMTANVPQTFTWDGKNENGDPVASGLYFFRLRVDLGTYIKKLLVVR